MALGRMQWTCTLEMPPLMITIFGVTQAHLSVVSIKIFNSNGSGRTDFGLVENIARQWSVHNAGFAQQPSMFKEPLHSQD